MVKFAFILQPHYKNHKILRKHNNSDGLRDLSFLTCFQRIAVYLTTQRNHDKRAK